MKDPVRPNRGKLASIDVREEVAEGAAHELVGGQRAEAISTQPPPAMPKPPPKELRGRRTLAGMAPAQPEAENLRDSREIGAEILLAEITRRAEEARAARAEADELRRALDASRQAQAVVVSLTPAPDKKAFLRLLYSLGGALVLLMGAATAWLSGHTVSVENKVDVVDQKRAAEKVVTDPLPGQVAELERQNARWKVWARKYADFDRQIFGKLGVVIHEPPNALPVEPIKTTARVRKPNSVTSAPILEVDSDPPELP